MITLCLLCKHRLLEGTIRSVNNLLQKFRQSFFLHLLSSPAKFISVGVYIPPLLFLQPLFQWSQPLYTLMVITLLPKSLITQLKPQIMEMVKTQPNRSLLCTCWVSSSHCFLTLFVKYRLNILQLTAPSCTTTSSSLLFITFVTIPGCSPFSSHHNGTN